MRLASPESRTRYLLCVAGLGGPLADGPLRALVVLRLDGQQMADDVSGRRAGLSSEALRRKPPGGDEIGHARSSHPIHATN